MAGERSRDEIERAQARVEGDDQSRPFLLRQMVERLDASGRRVGGVESVGEGALEPREIAARRVMAPSRGLAQEFGEPGGKPARVAEARRFRGDVILDQRAETVVAHMLAQHRKIIGEKFREAQAVAVAIDGEIGAFPTRRRGKLSEDRMRRVVVGRENRLLESGLHGGERGSHATRLKPSCAVGAAMARARSSSASRSSKSGKLSSRSIIVGTFPKRLTASA